MSLDAWQQARALAGSTGGRIEGAVREPRFRQACRVWLQVRESSTFDVPEESPIREARLEGEERNETADEAELRKARWRQRDLEREREKARTLEVQKDKGWRWVGGKWVTRDEARAWEERIEAACQESRLQHAKLELELRRRVQARSGVDDVDPAVAEDLIAAKWAEDNLARFGDELLSTLALATSEAARLGRADFGVDAVMLGVMSSSAGLAICREGLALASSGDEDALKAALEAAVQSPGSATPRELVADLPFTPALRRLLEAVEAERSRLGHNEASLGHLLLTLTSDNFVEGISEAFAAVGLDPKQLRPAALESLGGFLAITEASAEAWLLRHCEEVQGDSAAQPRGRPVAGLRTGYATITDGLVERSVEAKLLLLAALSGEHLFLLGSPGTAKSLLARRLSKVCAGSYFERLLTRFSVPEELFGPLSLQALEQDELRRKTRGFLPEANVAFIDEIFKANSSILNTLLVILNERCFDNGEFRVRVPLWCCVAASNELADTEELDALYDRFLLRRSVRRISANAVPLFLRLTLDTEEGEEEDAAVPNSGGSSGTGTAPALSAATSRALQAHARSVIFPDRLLQVVAELREYLAEEAEPPFLVSDRRLARAVRLIRIAAAAIGASTVVEADLLLLRHTFWDREPDQGELVTEWLLRRIGESGSGVKAWTFLFDSLRKRLRSDLSGEALDAARRDLGNLREAALAAFDVQLGLARDAPHASDVLERSDAPEAPRESQGENVDRFFWLSEDELRDVASMGKQATQNAAALGKLIVDAAVLAAAANVRDEARRRSLLEELLGTPEAPGEDADGPERDEWGDEL